LRWEMGDGRKIKRLERQLGLEGGDSLDALWYHDRNKNVLAVFHSFDSWYIYKNVESLSATILLTQSAEYLLKYKCYKWEIYLHILITPSSTIIFVLSRGSTWEQK
jgi:hypothetical protein